MSLLFKFDRTLYTAVRLLFRLILGRHRRDKLFRDHKITFDRFLFGDPVVAMNGIKAHVRRNSSDYDILRNDAESILHPHLVLREGETFVDVGANIGRYTIQVALSHRNVPIKIVSIEAHSVTFAALRRNVIDCNKLLNVILVNKAVSAKREQIEFFELEGLSDFNSRYRKQGKKLILQADTLDNILEQVGVKHPDLVKIDVEGAELDVLKGSSITLRNAQKVIVEVHNADLNDYGGFVEIQKVLEEAGLNVNKLQSAFVFALGERR